MNQDLRQALRDTCRRDEAACVAPLIDAYRALAVDQQAVQALAGRLVTALRADRRQAGGVDHLMHEFSLSSQEGVALMCLAEALLRIPDTATADRLIRDKIRHGDWAAHLGGSRSLFVNAATWGLMLTGRLVATHSTTALGHALSALIARSGEPLIRKAVDYAMRLLGQQFVMGEDIDAALARARSAERAGYRHSFDMLGEAALTEADALRYGAAYTRAIHAIGQASDGLGVIDGPGISIKLSALHPRYMRSQRARVMAELLPRLKDLALLARHYDIGLQLDAEEADRLELSLDLLEALATDPALAGWHGLGTVVQTYQKRAPVVIEILIALARRSGRRLPVRLVKGAYWDSEIKRAQVEGLTDYPVYTRKAHTDLAYLVCAGRLLAAPDALYPQFATHNAHTVACVHTMAQAVAHEDYEFQCLHGMGEALYAHVVGSQHLARPCRIYAPVGTHATLLPYLVRRLLENGANSSFVNRLVDPGIALETLVADPGETVLATGGSRHPALPPPPALFAPGRRNSAGLDLADDACLNALDQALERSAAIAWQAGPAIPGELAAGESQPVFNPADRADRLGEVRTADLGAVDLALANAVAASPDWHRTPGAERSRILQTAADLLEANRLALIALAIREAGKTRANALAEVREAADFLRYYGQPENSAKFEVTDDAPGPAVCISPWNFPLAIFIGQISAALASGSPVIAKPAEQTPLIAQLAVTLLHQAGVPPAVLQCLPGPGETIGAALCADGRTRSILFTGSTAVARAIHQSIAARGNTRLIAETGGQNALIADSSAHLEQLVQDALNSAFDSAGQRCSALRLLCLQHDIAEPALALLKAAMLELAIGDPRELSTDLGPVIDAAARQRLDVHIARMRERGHAVFQVHLPEACRRGHFVAPTVIEIESPAALGDEVFGPVVHVLRFAGEQLGDLLDAINGLGYGLTMGLHSRIDETIDLVTARARVGNLYVNRNVIGAVVGVQPFGGEGLSGTGPKAGGPLMLPRLCDQPVVTPALLGATGPPPAPPPRLQALHDWAIRDHRPALVEICQRYTGQSLLDTCLPLPGPTGERNTLRFVPRGRVLCLAPDLPRALHQLAAVFATGNTACVADDALAAELAAVLPDALVTAIERRVVGEYGGLAAVLVSDETADTPALRTALAATPGPLIALLRPAPNAFGYPLQRLVGERTVSVNTAAAGGNTRLMALAL